MSITMANRYKVIITVGLILIDKESVLLLRRVGTGWRDGQYGLVGGCLDPNESVTKAVIREAHEEANIILKPEWLTMASVMHHKSEKHLKQLIFSLSADNGKEPSRIMNQTNMTS